MDAPKLLPVVIGTAGHIDHGKSALIEALTGTHPDRWREEQERGITLDLGYAQMSWEDGRELGFVDVPGHERLVRKMVAGATGMGAAMLVVACDDGVMPQTREHFQVLQLLGVAHGIVAMTKADLADPEMLSLVRADVEELLAGTSWEGCAVLPVSSHSGAGLAELRRELRKVAERAQALPDRMHAFRLPVQRSFALHGAGTVVTGICASGWVREGDLVEIQPAGLRSRVRRVQVHGRQAAEGRPGLRVALNLPEADPAACPRGAVVVAVGSARSGRLARGLFEPMPGAPALVHGAEVQLLAGTAAVRARAFLPPDFNPDSGGAAALLDLELAEPTCMVPGERFLLRRPSPAINVGAGTFLTFAERRLRKRDADSRGATLAFGAALSDPPLLAARALELHSSGPSSALQIAGFLGWSPAAAAEALSEACARGEARQLTAERFVGSGRASSMAKDVVAAVGRYRKAHPHRLRIPLGSLRELLGREKARTLEQMPTEDLRSLGLERRRGLEWGLADSSAPPEIAELARRLEAELARARLTPPDLRSLAAGLGVSPGRVGEAADYLRDCDRAVRVGAELVFAREAVEELRQAVVEQFGGQGIHIPSLRDRFATTRKFLMPLLEYLDECGVTTRRGPNRILKDPAAALS